MLTLSSNSCSEVVFKSSKRWGSESEQLQVEERDNRSGGAL